jgi:hypothetical protein
MALNGAKREALAEYQMCVGVQKGREGNAVPVVPEPPGRSGVVKVGRRARCRQLTSLEINKAREEATHSRAISMFARRSAQLEPVAGAALRATLENVLLAFDPRVVIAAMHTTMMSASMTAYSTAVGPSSFFRNSTNF